MWFPGWGCGDGSVPRGMIIGMEVLLGVGFVAVAMTSPVVWWLLICLGLLLAWGFVTIVVGGAT